MKRRDFLSRAGLLLGSVGVAEGFKLDLLDKVARTLIPSANAQSILPRRVIEVSFRSGIPMMIFGTGKEFADLKSPRYSNFGYAGTDIEKVADVSNLYMSVDSKSLAKHGANIAITQGVRSDGGHTDLFNWRQGGTGMGKVSPIVELADANTTSSVIHGVKWPGGARNSLAGRRDLVSVTPANFTNLFKNPRLQMTGEELKGVLGAAEKLSRRQALLLEDKLEGSLGHFQSYQKANQLFNVDYSSLLDISKMPSAFSGSMSYGDVRRAFAYTLKGFANNLVNSSHVVIQLGDWHGYQQAKATSGIVRDISSILSAVIDELKATQDIAAPGKTLWDTTTIVAGTEFTRGISQFSIDNNDGGTQGFMLIGKNVRGNYYGGFTLEDSDKKTRGMAHGIDPKTGDKVVGSMNTTAQVYQTVRGAIGLPQSFSEREATLQAMLG